jgi:hypothetical protein
VVPVAVAVIKKPTLLQNYTLSIIWAGYFFALTTHSPCGIIYQNARTFQYFFLTSFYLNLKGGLAVWIISKYTTIANKEI